MEIVRHTYRILLHTLIFSVYAIFFSVQFFFNFEGLSNSQTLFKYCSSLHAAPKDRVSAESILSKAQPSPAPTGHGTRLNKRFHQETMPPCDVISMVIPEQYIPLQAPDYYTDVHLPAAIRVNHPLRGPPVVA